MMAFFPLALVLLMVAAGAAAHPAPALPDAVPAPGLVFGNGTGDSSTFRVIGGTPVGWAAAAGMHAKLTANGDTHFVCGGSLITARHVLTAAHCVAFRGAPRPPTAFHVRLGGMDVDHGLVRAVSAISVHPEYAIGRSSHADVAVLTLDRTVGQAEAADHHLRMVTLNEDASRPAPGSTAVLSGWGHSTEAGGATVDKLLRVRLRVLTHAECLRVHSGGGSVAENDSSGTSAPAGGRGRGALYGREWSPELPRGMLLFFSSLTAVFSNLVGRELTKFVTATE